MLRNSKKSAIEVQFNWIFVIIAGTVIFMFIISLILSQKKDVDVQVSQDVIKQLSTNIKGKQQLTNTFSQMEIPKTTLTFTCDASDLTSDFKISGSQREPLQLEIIFAPREFNTQTLNIWTLDFAVPFTVTRFIYITPPNTIFVIYNYTSAVQTQAKIMHDALPANMTKKYASSLTELDAAIKGYKKYRVICFENNCPANTYDYINIKKVSNELFGHGVVGYKNNNINDNSDLKYIGEASLFGAIFSDTESYYRCQMARAFKQFEIKRKLHFERVRILEEDLNLTNPSCVPVFALPRSTLGSMKDKKLSDAEELYSYSIQLKRDNTDLTFKGCPLIY